MLAQHVIALQIELQRPVAVLKAKNSRPDGASESKSKISRWKSSGFADAAAAANA